MKKLRIRGGFAVLISTAMVLPSLAIAAGPKPVLPIWETGLTVDKRYTVVTESCTPPGTKGCPSSGIRNCGVQDHETGLMWEAIISDSTLIWKSAPEFCYDKIGCGRMGWRPPTIEELTSHIDPAQNPALPAGHPYTILDPDGVVLSFWSATTANNTSTRALVMDLVGGFPDFVTSGFKTADQHRAGCVRGGATSGGPFADHP